MSQIISSVVPSCRTSPFTIVRIRFPWKSQSSTSAGPSGHSVSDPFTRSIEPASVSRKSCSPKSLPIVYPAMYVPASSGAIPLHSVPITMAISPS